MSFKIKIDEALCKSCGLCLGVCPKKIMVISERKNRLGFRVAACVDEKKCTGCMACAQVCPDIAIEIFQEEQE